MFCSALLLLLLLCNWGLLGFVSGSPAVEEAYGAVASILSPGQSYLTGESLHSLFNTLEKRVQCGEVPCEKCDLADAVHQLISNQFVHKEEESRTSGENVTVTVSQFTALTSGCVLYLFSPGLVCTAIRRGTWGEEAEHFLHKFTHHDHQEHKSEPHHDHEHIDIHGLEGIIQELHNHYEPTESENCVSASDIMAQVNASPGDQIREVGAVLGYVLYHTLQGHCFTDQSLPEEGFFVDYIMDRLGTENFTVQDLKALMKSLNIGPDQEEDHEHEQEHRNNHMEDEHVDHDHSVQRWRKRHSHDRDEGHERNGTWEQRCFSAEQLVLIYGLEENSSASSGLGRPAVAQLSTALVQQILSGACADITDPPIPDGLSKTERYIYATIANLVITLTSMFGIVVLLCTACTSGFQMCIQFCISLAVGSLTGDALLHLIPTFLNLHVHSENDGSSKHTSRSHEEGSPDYIYKMLVLMAGIYYFYLMEVLFSLITHKDENKHHNHNHEEASEPHHCDHGRVLEMYQKEMKQKDKLQSTSKADLVSCENSEKSFPEPKERTREQRLLPYMITIGDGIHNFADGLAMGAAFALSWKSGLATSLAVLCHELPHELGDFAILLHIGVSVRRALILNFCSALISFIGLYIALSVATDLATKQWIAAITAGLFLYVGLADMLPTMIHISNKRPWLTFLLQNVGLLTGWSILLLLSLYEEKIHF
ncbi:zinc transporter ZIP4 [Archocentrus centrarchus]|uniref:zinc transporter ZIP4 n=1 Tax=Archocentrus centrarchus TaxID=63155 RepID=UPI0011E9B369|nr:zinc transporter ZIP4 [Archocentrus centrarchus]